MAVIGAPRDKETADMIEYKRKNDAEEHPWSTAYNPRHYYHKRVEFPPHDIS